MQQMDSILHQDETPDEIVICDDGSTDHTDEIVAEIVSQSMVPCYFYKNEKNLGYIHNFEKAISLCKGDIVFLSDQDNVWHSTLSSPLGMSGTRGHIWSRTSGTAMHGSRPCGRPWTNAGPLARMSWKSVCRTRRTRLPRTM